MSKPKHDVKVGDIFQCSWGYDQTNIDYYEVTRVMASMVEVREIAATREETAWLQGECVPAPGHYIGEPMRKRVAVYGSGPCIRIYSFASAYRIKPTAVVDGVKTFPVSNWSAYA
jgi:hypothetical protein